MTRQINIEGFSLIKRNEGVRLKAYRDIAGIWTIGVGHIPAHQGQTITVEEADNLLQSDIQHACMVVDALTHDVSTTNNQFSAMVSLAFNIGGAAFRGSHVLSYHRAGQLNEAADAFLSWDKAHINGKLVTVEGLLRRRQEEAALYSLGEDRVHG